MTEFEKELEYLKTTLIIYDEILDDSKLKLKNLNKLYHGNHEELLREKFKLENEIKSITNAKEKPFFGRIDFENHKSDIKDICYIGKKGVMDFDNKIITIDWRAPIASLYYDSNLGKASYLAPEGEIIGDLLIKRQYEIENSKLKAYQDIDTVSNDDLLKPYLNITADKRLKNIVSSIQSEQNKIIRENITKSIIIQGVAGSGKTTVALHRIAYLVYNYRELYNQDQYIIIGPNKFFVNYISSILPDLDVNAVTQCDLQELFMSFMGDSYSINNRLDNLSSNLSILEKEFSSFRTSFEIKNQIDCCLTELEENIIPNKNLKIKDFNVLSRKKIFEIINDVNLKSCKNINDKVERIILLLSNYIEKNSELLNNQLVKHYLDKCNDNIEGSISKEIINAKNEIKNGCKNILKKYFDISKVTSKDIYLQIVEMYGTEDNLILVQKKLESIKKNDIELEDTIPLMYIEYLLKGQKDCRKYKHVVIDEAQDYNIFTFFTLKSIFSNATFSIYGDIAQSLYEYRSIANWEVVKELVFENKIEILKLNKSYRTTIEIMQEANKINKYLNLTEALPVIRHGHEVNYIKIEKDNKIKLILDLIKKIKMNNLKTIGIISKTKENSKEIYTELKNNVEISLIESKNTTYSDDVCCITSYLAKGLEFDAVIIEAADEFVFDINSVLDMKLLYVSMTRPLHELYVIYNDKLVSIL